MIKQFKSAPVFFLATAIVCLYGSGAFAAIDYNLKVPSGNCKLMIIEKCFNRSTSAKTFEVGNEVTQLSDMYSFCTNIITSTIGKPARIILVLDNSESMCQDPPACRGSQNNDPTNKRVAAADTFLDNVAAKCSVCEVGVLVYIGVDKSDSSGAGTISSVTPPLPLTAANVATLHAAIHRGGCNGRFSKIEETDKLAKRTKTFTGLALDSAIKMMDQGYDTLINKYDRHIILLTDGGWQTPTTQQIFDAYKLNNPTHVLPVIHGVFLSDSAAHVAKGYPPQGQLSCDTLDTVNLDYMRQAATQTGGMFFPGTTPQSIAATFDSLFKMIVDTNVTGLVSVTFTNAATNEVKIASFTPDPEPSHYTVRVPDAFPLVVGTNTFIVTMVTQDKDLQKVTTYDTITVNRHATVGTGSDTVFTKVCNVDTIKMSITCRPPALEIPAFDTVRAAVAPEDISKFVPGNIRVRAFTSFPDETDPKEILLFHCDDNNLANSVAGGAAATQKSATISAAGAFGSCISAGSFSVNLPNPISDDFTFECWIRSNAAGQTGSIVSGSGFTFGISGGILSATVGGKSIKINHAVDINTWQHVAVARLNGVACIYINGIPMADTISAPGQISAGSLTIGNFTGGLLDEIRLSSYVRGASLQGKIVVQIPTSSTIIWKVNSATSEGADTKLPPSMWQGTPAGQLQFQFSDHLPEEVIINLSDTLTQPSLMWSKNGDPVTFTTNGVPTTATLKDTSHDGHLDRIDITWTDNITLKPIPGVNEFIDTMFITVQDGNTTKTITLTGLTMYLDPANNKTIHIILNQNTGPTLETVWNDAKITLKNIKMTTDGKTFNDPKIIDGADPIPVEACYAPSNNTDSLKITFSESIAGLPLTAANFMRVQTGAQGDVRIPLSSFNPLSVAVSPTNNKVLIIVYQFTPSGTHTIEAYTYQIQEAFGAVLSPSVPINFCYFVSLIDSVKAGPNPMSLPGITNGPTITYSDGSTQQISGMKVEIKLKWPVDNASGKEEIFAWLTVFDAVGNLLLDNEPFGKESERKLSMGWKGRNKAKMQVAGGTYLGRYVVRRIIDGETKQEESGKIKLGVKTRKDK